MRAPRCHAFRPPRRDEEARRGAAYAVVDPGECLWSLDEEEMNGEEVRVLMVTIARPDLTEEEITWKKGGQCEARACGWWCVCSAAAGLGWDGMRCVGGSWGALQHQRGSTAAAPRSTTD